MRVSRSRDISRVTGRSTLSRSATCCLRKRIRCSCKVACISARRTKERAIFKSADTLVMPWLEIWWVSSAILPQQRSTCSAGQPRTCPIRFSLFRKLGEYWMNIESVSILVFMSGQGHAQSGSPFNEYWMNIG